MTQTDSEQRTREFDAAVVEAASPLRVLDVLAWPADSEARFLASYRAGSPKLPEPGLVASDTRKSVEALEAVADRCDRGDPLQAFVRRTALSYAVAGRMLAAVGTPEFSRCSEILYGAADDRYETQEVTAVEAAEFLLTATDAVARIADPPALTMDATAFADRLRPAMREFFVHDDVDVVLDDRLAARAMAGGKKVRLRASARFSELDFDQLLQHEAFVHSATLLNGLKQPLRSLGLSTPRTTRTQEGIAVFAELATTCIDIPRLQRIALRVLAMKLARDGGDFIEVFRYFLAAGQSEEESYRSTQRLFRGGDVRGKVVFTKDCVYLKGLLEVHAFLRVLVRDNRPELLAHVFAGRLTLGDVVALAPCFEGGELRPAVYLPPWARQLTTLGSMLAYSAFATQLKLADVTLEHFRAFDERKDVV
jgi:uncharacterized protein (TIGR02421 family)